MRTNFVRCGAGLLLVATTCAYAQLLPPRGIELPPVTSTTPVDPHEQLTFFEGNWEIVGLPAGNSFHESCSWMSQARRHLVCRAATQAGNTLHESMSVLSYRSTDGNYVYHAFEPDGTVFTMEGRRQPDGSWQFSGVQGTGASQRRTRMTIRPGGERSFIVQQDQATGTGPWQRQTEVRYVPARPR